MYMCYFQKHHRMYMCLQIQGHASSKSLVYVKLYCLSARFYTFLHLSPIFLQINLFLGQILFFFIVPEKLWNLYGCSIYRNLSNYINSFKFLFLQESRGSFRYTTFLLHIKIIFVFSFPMLRVVLFLDLLHQLKSPNTMLEIVVSHSCFVPNFNKNDFGFNYHLSYPIFL